jgi:hypothetical protein
VWRVTGTDNLPTKSILFHPLALRFAASFLQPIKKMWLMHSSPAMEPPSHSGFSHLEELIGNN